MVSAMTDERCKWQCNQKCIFCYAAGQEMGKTKELTTGQWKQVIDRLESARVPMVTFTGGEPSEALGMNLSMRGACACVGGGRAGCSQKDTYGNAKQE